MLTRKTTSLNSELPQKNDDNMQTRIIYYYSIAGVITMSLFLFIGFLFCYFIFFLNTTSGANTIWQPNAIAIIVVIFLASLSAAVASIAGIIYGKKKLKNPDYNHKWFFILTDCCSLGVIFFWLTTLYILIYINQVKYKRK